MKTFESEGPTQGMGDCVTLLPSSVKTWGNNEATQTDFWGEIIRFLGKWFKLILWSVHWMISFYGFCYGLQPGSIVSLTFSAQLSLPNIQYLAPPKHIEMHKTHPGRQREQIGCLWDINSRSTVFYLRNMETQTHWQADVLLKDRVKMKERPAVIAWNLKIISQSLWNLQKFVLVALTHIGQSFKGQTTASSTQRNWASFIVWLNFPRFACFTHCATSSLEVIWRKDNNRTRGCD